MKRILLLVALAFTSLPGIAMAIDLTDPSTTIDPTVTVDTSTFNPSTCTNCYSTDIKAYGDQTASHSIGTMNVSSYETGHTNTFTDSFKGTANVINGSPCVGAGCNFQISQGDFTTTSSNGWTDSSTDINVASYTANVSMSSFGGMAVCTTPNPAAYGNFSQVQNISQNLYGANGSTSAYSGTQNLTIKSYNTP